MLTDFIEFLENNPGIYSEEKLRLKIIELNNLKHLKELREKDDILTYNSQLSLVSNESLLTSGYVDELECLNKVEIFQRLKGLKEFDQNISEIILDEMKKVEEEQKLEKDKYSRINNAGETRLHVEARSDNYELLKKLIEKVNFLLLNSLYLF